MKKNYFTGLIILTILLSIPSFSQVNVTLKVDMTGQTINADGIHVVGTINGWSTNATILTEEGATGIYSVTIPLNEGWHRYKFLNGNTWGTEETANYPCAPSNGDRYLYINNSNQDVVLETVPFNGCNTSGTGFEVTFNVDMASEGTIAAGNVHMAGWLTDWNPSVLSFPNANGNIHSATLRLPTPADYPITFEYKYLSAAGWGNDETPGPDDSCATVSGGNRLITVNTSGENIYDIFNACNYTLSNTEFTIDALKIAYSPTDRVVKLLNKQFDNTLSQIEVFEITGKSIKVINNIKEIKDTLIDFKNQSNGLYFVKIKHGNKQLVKKIMVY
ncbi:MAG: hypothetical protein ACI9NI_002622 [Olleya marilimosa]|jgi:hypothetical protein